MEMFKALQAAAAQRRNGQQGGCLFLSFSIVMGRMVCWFVMFFFPTFEQGEEVMVTG